VTRYRSRKLVGSSGDLTLCRHTAAVHTLASGRYAIIPYINSNINSSSSSSSGSSSSSSKPTSFTLAIYSSATVEWEQGDEGPLDTGHIQVHDLYANIHITNYIVVGSKLYTTTDTVKVTAAGNQ
jgi:hypothetical protein